jgi:hypothetical protein
MSVRNLLCHSGFRTVTVRVVECVGVVVPLEYEHVSLLELANCNTGSKTVVAAA